MTLDLKARLQATVGDAYHVQDELPGGGMSQLFTATEVSLGRKVVIKLLPPELASEVSAQRFQREIALTADLQHPHVLPILTAGSRDGLLYYITPYVAGESLRQRLVRDGKLPLSDALRILLEIADALAYAHHRKVVHRDIKPENILLSGDHALLADFGVARALEEAGVGQRLTATSTSVGTPGYMAPEQIAGDRNADATADVYALAVVAYEMFSGKSPFAGKSGQNLVAAHFTETPKPLTDIPARIAAAIAKALSKSPEDRFPTAAEFRNAIAAPASTQSGRGRRRIAIVSGALAAVILVALGAWRFVAGRAPAAGDSRKMLAVLPFENLGQPEDQFFAEGVTEELTSRLASLHELGVISRTSSNQYRKTTKSLKQIGQELGVQYVLEGSVRWEKTASGYSGSARQSAFLGSKAEQAY